MKKVLAAICFVLFCHGFAFAAHPLITDDTGTQGEGKFQLEINGEVTHDKETTDGVTTKEKGGEAAAAISYGITDDIDVVIGVPYQWKEVKEDDAVASDNDGISDVSIELKWRFFERDGFSFGLKPAVILPTGDENKGLGNGKASYGATFIATKEAEPLTFHLNLAYTRNEYKLQEDEAANRKDIWHASLAMEAEIIENLRAVGNIGIEKNPDKASNTDPAFILAGIIYSVTEDFDIDLGVKTGLNKPETDYSILAGIALRF